MGQVGVHSMVRITARGATYDVLVRYLVDEGVFFMSVLIGDGQPWLQTRAATIEEGMKRLGEALADVMDKQREKADKW